MGVQESERTPSADSQLLQRFLHDYLGEQFELKFKKRSYGKVTVELIFADGELTSVEMQEDLKIKAKDLKRKE